MLSLCGSDLTLPCPAIDSDDASQAMTSDGPRKEAVQAHPEAGDTMALRFQMDEVAYCSSHRVQCLLSERCSLRMKKEV